MLYGGSVVVCYLLVLVVVVYRCALESLIYATVLWRLVYMMLCMLCGGRRLLGGLLRTVSRRLVTRL